MLAAACGEPGVGGVGAHAVRVDTIGGVPHVLNAGDPPRWSLEPVLDIGLPGGAGEPEPAEFGRVHGLAVDADGNVWVGDQQGTEIRRFGADGSFRGAFGRSGQGPGELVALHSMAWLGDTLAVLDGMQGRVLLFDPAGAPLGQWPYPGGLSGSPSTIRFYQISRFEAYGFAPLRDGEFPGVSVGFLRFTPEGRTGALPRRPPPGQVQGTVVCPEPDTGIIRIFSNPFAIGVLRHPTVGAAVLEARTDSVRIAWVGGRGDTVRVMDDRFSFAPLTDEDWEEATADVRDFHETHRGVRCEGEAVRPPHQPPLIGAEYDAEGRLWLELRTAEGTAFRVYDPEGRLLAQLAAPERSDRIPPAFGPGWMAVLVEGEYGEDVVRLFRIIEAR